MGYELGYPKLVSKVYIGLLMYGGGIEVLQRLTGWRSGDLVDWLADGIGILLGGAALNTFILKRPKLFRPNH